MAAGEGSGGQPPHFARVRGIAPEFAAGRSARVRLRRTTSPASGDGVVQRCRLPIGVAGGASVTGRDHKQYCLWSRRRAGASDAGLYQEQPAFGGQGKAQAASYLALREFGVLRRNSPLAARPWSDP
jgi:hypothetical protein